MNSAGDCQQDFKNKIYQFDKDNLNTSLAMECAIAGWTVPDWIFKCDGQRLGYESLRDLQDEIKKECQELEHLQDIANARKHKEVTRYTPLVKSSGKREGAFSSGFSRGFDITRLVLQTDAGEISFWTTLQSVLDYYDLYFKKNNIT
ncbi:hypothetical protein SAMN04515647_0589 [Cohaesibacter sp. ES.047]|uniref:hypothetical protein n=1 Tax=Cohaesibacter sp. ES.047 TaxID=1798205 RepID=UPI000BB78908|nr:hypothetical protein [Cohaesibacter sp. ES.047]SNY90423.1 hypothetical protein SAMN04515647_0589 [Cohaesibacter sp. ES.047]